MCDKDLGLCDHLKHTIPTTTNKPVYLPHCTNPVQLQMEIHKCLDMWLKQGIIHPSQSPYASQVVIIHKKSGELCLCIDVCAFNTITLHDSFPLLWIKEALQAVKAAVWFTSFNLAEGYLQLAINEADIHKTAFCVGLQVCTSLLVCLSDSLMQVLVFVTSWRCVLGTSSIIRSCSTLMISESLVALLMRC